MMFNKAKLKRQICGQRIITQVSVSLKEIIIVIWLPKYIFMSRLTLTCEFSIDHDIQVFLWVSTGVSGDGVQANGGIIQCETHS